ncbi:NADH-quinone oxidoreductase subunit J family protein [Lyticum sinuosum]|uniref:NADH-quinone oxidoreductase subunit J n=1 Tax=Lyticum sinuosum TaxID=1332059 RepID=A0AAE4VJY4_9RICK|nr:NADH-quinone oxidoreductase subunit J [Lyticum sinuosum]MDZ5761316.1 NADH-quinone oxidoreductase subunit J [Lyticum sinuosum]
MILVICGCLAFFASIMVVSTNNTIHSVFFLIVVFIFTGIGIIITCDEFLGISLIIICVGAIAILFLFSIMMINLDFIAKQNIIYKLINTLFIFIFVFLPFVCIQYDTFNKNSSISFQKKQITQLKKVEQYNNENITNNVYSSKSNFDEITNHLYENSWFQIQLAGIILLAGIISSITIIISNFEFKSIKKHNIDYYSTKSVDLIKISPGDGAIIITNKSP